MRTRLAVLCLIALVVAAHVGLWRSQHVPEAAKLRLTLLNAAGWSVVLLPALAVGLWAKAIRRRNLRQMGETRPKSPPETP